MHEAGSQIQTTSIPASTAWKFIALFLLLIFCTMDRWQGLGTKPDPYYTTDEIGIHWHGISLLRTGKPISWSGLGVFFGTSAELGQVLWEGHTYHMVSPYLEQPPLFALLTGAVAILAGTEPHEVVSSTGTPVTIWSVNIPKVRLLALTLFVFTFLFLFEIARREFGLGAALLAVAIYGVCRVIVFHNRMAMSENFTTPLLLGNVLALQRYTSGGMRRRTFGIITVALIAAACLSKLYAVSNAAPIAYLLSTRRRYHDLWFVVAGVVIGLGGAVSFGIWHGGMDLYIGMLKDQKVRFGDFNALPYLIVPRGGGILGSNYLIFAGWVATFMALARGRSQVLVVPVVHALALTFFIQAIAIERWHALPYFPFACLGLAVLVVDAWRSTERLLFFAAIALLLPHAFNFLGDKASSLLQPARYLYAAVVAAIILFSDDTRAWHRRFMRGILAGACALALLRELW